MTKLDDLTIGEARALAAQFNVLTAQKVVPTAAKIGGEVPVIVCTDKRGVVFGYTDDTTGDTITLKNARMCLYWSTDVGGVFGLAEKGPTKECKISAVAPSIELRGVTAVFSVDPGAVAAWTKAPIQGR